MYAVIFKAVIKQLDDQYAETASRMRTLAIDSYGCKDFIACTEGTTEIAISYWDSLEAIQAWKNDPNHLLAQKQGQEKWYESYSVEITHIEKHYSR